MHEQVGEWEKENKYQYPFYDHSATYVFLAEKIPSPEPLSQTVHPLAQEH